MSGEGRAAGFEAIRVHEVSGWVAGKHAAGIGRPQRTAAPLLRIPGPVRAPLRVNSSPNDTFQPG